MNLRERFRYWLWKRDVKTIARDYGYNAREVLQADPEGMLEMYEDFYTPEEYFYEAYRGD